MESFKLFDEVLLGKSNPAQLGEYLRNKNIPNSIKTIGKSVHIRSYEHGFQVEYQAEGSEAGIVSYNLLSVFLYICNQKSKPYSPSYALPYKMHANTPIKAAVMLLGQPTSKSKYSPQCSWKHLGIDIAFIGLSWSDQTLKMDYICLYPPLTKNGSLQCSVCHKQIKQSTKSRSCSDCQALIKYCSEDCKQKHYRLHKMYCQEIDQN